MQWLKGHGTENDFVLLPDHEGRLELSESFVAALCDRRRGIGADGVLRVVRVDASVIDRDSSAEWFMDYRNADGSIAQMCGNGIRVFARHLVDDGLVASEQFEVATRDGDKHVTVHDDDSISVEMGPFAVGRTSKVSAAGRTWEALEVHTGNPHAVAFVDSVADAGGLLDQPEYDAGVYPKGVNIEFVERLGSHHARMRVFERGSGETRSCGTGACAVGIALAQSSGDGEYRIDVPGGTVHVTVTHGHSRLSGPAEIVARGDLEWLA